jgi:WS/DGAT/MGAT family acyltransferase
MSRVWRAAQDGVRGGVSQMRAFAGLLSRPSEALAEIRAAGEALSEGLRIAFSPVPATPFNGHVSTLRRIVWATFDLREVKAVKNRLGGTVNDVVLTVISAALRRYLEARGHDPDRVELRAMCPVNVRASEEHLHLGNRVSMLVAPLPVGIFDPLERMRQVRTAMAQIKKSGESSRMTKMLDLLNLVPPPLQAPLGSIPVAAAPLNTVCTNVPGPPVSLYVQGRRIEILVPMVPLAQGIGLAFAIMSYADTLTIGVTFDPALIRDGATISDLLDESYEELRGLAGVERTERRSPVLPERRRRLRSTPSQVA